MSKKVIIAIHGIGNKPPQPLLQHWWKSAICEGLEHRGHMPLLFRFHLVYWAHYLYSEPQDLRITDSGHPLHVDNPYVKSASVSLKTAYSFLRKKMLDFAELIMDFVFFSENRFFNFDRFGDYVIRKKFRDLELYYHTENVELQEAGLHAKKMIRDELVKALRKHRKDDIMLISHSMGTVIAYDVLMHLVPDITINTLVTLGSPLGLPAIMKRIFSELGIDFKKSKRLPTPENIRNAWLNFSDLHDHIAMNYTLGDDFAANSKGIGPQDIIVYNDYQYQGKENHHKSYGYLRSPEVADAIMQFQTTGEVSFLETLKLRGAELMDKLFGSLKTGV